VQTATITSSERRAILRSAGQKQANIHIEIIPGIALAPRTLGQSWHYTTRTGIPIDHPSAYSKRGWSSMVYHHSTRRVQVGGDWISGGAK
jgi:hypothetical protein